MGSLGDTWVSAEIEALRATVKTLKDSNEDHKKIVAQLRRNILEQMEEVSRLRVEIGNLKQLVISPRDPVLLRPIEKSFSGPY